MAMSRMNKVNLMTRGRKNDEGRYREQGGYGREGSNERGQYGGMNWGGMEQERNRGGWGNSDDMRREERGRYRDYDGQDDERYEGGGGRYAGNFRHRENSREHEAGEAVKFDEHKAKKWVDGMKNGDGTTGEHFKEQQAEQMRLAHCPDCDKHEFWAAMNMMYSDYCEVAKKMNMDRPDFYAHMAKAFLKDEDAGEDKLAKYMKYVAGK